MHSFSTQLDLEQSHYYFIISMLYVLSIIYPLTVIFIVIKNPQLICILPFQIDRLLVFDRSGLTIFSHNFNKNHKYPDVLITGLITAVVSAIQEITGSGRNVEYINLEDKAIVFNTKNNLHFVLISDKYTVTIAESLNSFMNQFLSRYKDILERESDDLGRYVNVFKESKDNCECYFSISLFMIVN